MLHNVEIVKILSATLKDLFPSKRDMPPLVIDPVMVSTSNHMLLEHDAIVALGSELIPLAYLITPNLPEGKILAGLGKETTQEDFGVDAMKALCQKLANSGCENVLLKGGHGSADQVIDVLYEAIHQSFTVFSHKSVSFGSQMAYKYKTPPYLFRRIVSKSTHGTGCTLSAAICTHLAEGRLCKSNHPLNK